MFTNQKEMTLCFRGSSLLCCELAVLISESAYALYIFVLLVDKGTLGIPQQHVECPLGKCWSAMPLSLMDWTSIKL
jgi:hypothetical protein